MTEKEHLERWLAELQEQLNHHQTQLEIYRLNKDGLNIKRRILQELTFQYGDAGGVINEHLDYESVKSELAELNSDEQEQEENHLREKIHVLGLAIQKIKRYLPQTNANTPS